MNLSMNSALPGAMNTATIAVAPALPGAAAADAALAPNAAQAPVQAAQPFPFQQWIALDGVPAPLAQAPSEAGASGDAAAAAADAAPADAAPEQPDAGGDALLAAMALPVPPAALPAMMMAMPGAPLPAARQSAAEAGKAPAAGAGLEAAPAAARGAPDAALPLPALPTQPSTEQAALQAALPAAAQPAAARAGAALPAYAPAPDAVAADAPDAPSGIAGHWNVQAASQPGTTRGADSVVLAGPPAAWRQTLHEALGERLQLQLGRGSEQATIRLEPPMLGRIDISVRHSGGNLEVHIAASNGEVLRQLNTVSDSLRNDLAGRQYANVSVNVSETPRAQAGAQAGAQSGGQPGADAQGRQRQQEGQQQRTPGLALNDAGDAGSLFTLN